jgi:hypothetical protein
MKVALTASVTIAALMRLSAMAGPTTVAVEGRPVYTQETPGGTIVVTHRVKPATPEEQRSIGPGIDPKESRLLYVHEYSFTLDSPGSRKELYKEIIEEFGPLFRIRPEVGIFTATTDADSLAAVFYYDERVFVLLARGGARVAQASLPEELCPGPDIAGPVRIEGSPAEDDVRIKFAVTSPHGWQTRNVEAHLERVEGKLVWRFVPR